MKKVILLIFLTFIYACSYGLTYNTYNPVPYFTNHNATVAELKKSLDEFGMVNVSGVKGNGKTELIKKYIFDYHNDYEIIAIFDSKVDLIPQLVNFTNSINETLPKAEHISLDYKNIQSNLINYLKHKKKWLLVFDNLLINKDIQNFLSLEGRGHIIVVSLNSNILKSKVVVNNLSKIYIKELLEKLIKEPEPELIEELTEVAVAQGYPTALIVDSTVFLINHPHYSVKEYIKKISENNEVVKNYLNLVFEEITENAKDLLFKIALLNNQEVSKNVLSYIVLDKLQLNESIEELLNLNILRMINKDRNHPIFAIHDIYKNELLKISNKNNNQKNLRKIIKNINYILPKNFKQDVASLQSFRQDITLYGNLEVLLNNADKYIDNNFDLLELRLNFMISLLESCYMGKAEESIFWFKEKVKANKINPKNDYEKSIYSTILVHLGANEFFVHTKIDEALNYLNMANELIEQLDGFLELKSYIYTDIAQVLVYGGELENARKYITKAEEVINGEIKKVPKILFVKSLLSYAEASYEKAGEYLDLEIDICRQIGLDVKKANPVIIWQKSRILNSIGKYQDAYNYAYTLYRDHISLLNDDNAVDMASILTQLARAEYGLVKYDDALKHASAAIEELLKDNKRNNLQIHESTDTYLAEAIVARADAFSGVHDYVKAIQGYNMAERIYRNIYKIHFTKQENISYILLQGAKAAINIKDEFWRKHFVSLLTRYFSYDHWAVQELRKYQSLNKT